MGKSIIGLENQKILKNFEFGSRQGQVSEGPEEKYETIEPLQMFGFGKTLEEMQIIDC